MKEVQYDNERTSGEEAVKRNLCVSDMCTLIIFVSLVASISADDLTDTKRLTLVHKQWKDTYLDVADETSSCNWLFRYEAPICYFALCLMEVII